MAQSMREHLRAAALKAFEDARLALECQPVFGSPEWTTWASLYEMAVDKYDAYLNCTEAVLRRASQPAAG